MYENRTLVRGDNLEEMRKFPDECIQASSNKGCLILDPTSHTRDADRSRPCWNIPTPLL